MDPFASIYHVRFDSSIFLFSFPRELWATVLIFNPLHVFVFRFTNEKLSTGKMGGSMPARTTKFMVAIISERGFQLVNLKYTYVQYNIWGLILIEKTGLV